MRRLTPFLILLIIFTSGIFVTQAQEVIGTTTSNLRVRTGAGTGYALVSTLPANTEVIAEARNAGADWLLAHTRDNSVRGWMSARYITLGADIAALQVSEEVINAAPIPSEPTPAAPVNVDPGTVTAVTGSNQLNLRAGAGTTFAIVTKLAARTTLIVEGRNSRGDWLKVHTVDNAFQGWVALRYVRLSGATAANLPVVDGAVVVSTDPAVAAVPGAVTIPGQAELLSGGVIANIRSIYQQGQALGNHSDVVIKLGDSTTAGKELLCTGYSLGKYGYLGSTLNYFGGSICANSLTAEYGYGTYTLLDPSWNTSGSCQGGESLLQCELRIKKPTVAIIYIGLVDMRYSTADLYSANLNNIVQTLISNGVIPVLMTITSSDVTTTSQSVQDRPPTFNGIVKGIASGYQIPLIDFQQIAHALPNQGCIEEGYHLNSRNGSSVSFNGDELIYGKELRELLVWQMLHAIKQNVIG